MGELRRYDQPEIGQSLTEMGHVYVRYVLTTAKLQDDVASPAKDYFDRHQVSEPMLLCFPSHVSETPRNELNIHIFEGLEEKIKKVMNLAIVRYLVSISVIRNLLNPSSSSC